MRICDADYVAARNHLPPCAGACLCRSAQGGSPLVYVALAPRCAIENSGEQFWLLQSVECGCSRRICARSRRYEMAHMFCRRLALPLWAILLFTVALTAPPPATVLLPPATLFVIVGVGLASIIFLMPGGIAGSRTSGSLVRVLPSRHRDRATAAVTIAAGTCVGPLDDPNGSAAAADALDLVRMDDDGGWQMTRPPA